MTAATCASSTGFPVALRIAVTDSLAKLFEIYLGPFLRDWPGQVLIRIACMVIK